MQPVLHCVLSSIKNVIRENETRNDEAPIAILKKRGKSEIKMEKLLFANVAGGKFCNKILFNLFVVNLKLNFSYQC
jgi:hypothetical protein